MKSDIGNRDLYELLQKCVCHDDVSFVWKTVLGEYFGVTPISRFQTDGMLTNSVSILMELKYKWALSNELDRAKIFVQMLFYMKNIYEKDFRAPTVLFAGTEKECLILHADVLIDYLDFGDIDWEVSPSGAYACNKELIKELQNVSDFQRIIIAEDDVDGLDKVIKAIKYFNTSVKRGIKISPKNIGPAFEHFLSRILISEKDLNANQLSNLFVQILIDPEDNYLHPNKQSTLQTCSYGKVKVNEAAYTRFFDHFDSNYSPKEKRRITAITDHLVGIANMWLRRFQGEFFTPPEIAHATHALIAGCLGNNWRESYICWDPCSGSMNLTRDVNFSNLFASTLHEDDIETAKLMKYDTNAKAVFQYDFLNDDVEALEQVDFVSGFQKEAKIDRQLLSALIHNKKILTYLNGPFAQASDIRPDEKIERKTGAGKNLVNIKMLSDGMGNASQQVYAQFLYRILLEKKRHNLTNLALAFFAPVTFLTGSNFKKFRKKWLQNFRFERGIIFRADHFDGVKGTWPVSFTIWTTGETLERSKFEVDVMELDNHHHFREIGERVLYNLDKGIDASGWAADPIRDSKEYITFPLLTNPINVKDDDKGRGHWLKGSLGYMHNAGNDIGHNMTHVGIYTAPFHNGNGFNILPANFERAACVYTARKLVKTTWSNHKDEYSAPDTKHPSYPRWANDAVIYSIFSNQSSMRNVEYKGKSYTIKNEWFFDSNKKMMRLANEYNNDEIYQDAIDSGDERFLFKLLNDLDISDDAKEIVMLARRALEISFKYRKEFHKTHPELHINAWDAGWYQLENLAKSYKEFSNILTVFKDLFREFEDRMRPGVYELGLLPK